MTLTDFLLARIAEDAAQAHEVQRYMPDGGVIEIHLSRRDGDETRSKIVRPYNPARVLAECEAKRRIVRLASECERHGYDNAAAYMNDALLALALPYADHPDYRKEWKP